jgi:hypothetical protein
VLDLVPVPSGSDAPTVPRSAVELAHAAKEFGCRRSAPDRRSAWPPSKAPARWGSAITWVRDTIVDGRVLRRDRALTTLDETGALADLEALA